MRNLTKQAKQEIKELLEYQERCPVRILKKLKAHYVIQTKEIDTITISQSNLMNLIKTNKVRILHATSVEL
jgi:hypothetical protein